MISEKVLALDFETTEVPFFDKRQKKSWDWKGHPRLAHATIVSFKSDGDAVATEHVSSSVLPQFNTLIFHNASFDIQVGINAGVWNEQQFL